MKMKIELAVVVVGALMAIEGRAASQMPGFDALSTVGCRVKSQVVVVESRRAVIKFMVAVTNDSDRDIRPPENGSFAFNKASPSPEELARISPAYASEAFLGRARKRGTLVFRAGTTTLVSMHARAHYPDAIDPGIRTSYDHVFMQFGGVGDGNRLACSLKGASTVDGERLQGYVCAGPAKRALEASCSRLKDRR